VAVEERAGHLLAGRLTVGVVAAGAGVAVDAAVLVGFVGGLHAPPAPGADHQPGQQAGPVAGHPDRVGGRPVGGQPRLVAFVLLDAEPFSS
jgi:hypothetical protein